MSPNCEPTADRSVFSDSGSLIPKPADFPSLGRWTAEEVAQAAGVFNTLDLKELDAKTARRIRRVSDEIEDIHSWIEVAADRPGDWLIGVHS